MGIVEEAPERPTGERVFYMPHKPVIKESAVTAKVRMVFDASTKPYPLANSISDCMFTGPPLQPLLWDIMVRARMSTNLLLGDIEKASLQIGVKEEDRDAFRFLFNVKGEERASEVHAGTVWSGSQSFCVRGHSAESPSAARNRI